MTIDLEAGGALATAGLAAKALDGHAQATTTHAGTCSNCAAQLVGPYCHACGQTGHVHRSIWHMLEEGLHGLLHFDSKTWRTLPLLVARPGLLTRRYIDGQRVRYVPPLGLFLFTIFMMFFVLSFTNSSGKSAPSGRTEARAELVKELENAKAEVVKATQQLAAAKDTDEHADAKEDLAEAQADERAAAALVSVFDKTAAAAKNPASTTVTADELKAMSRLNFNADGLKSKGVFKELANNPELMLYKFKNTAYKFSFMLIPLTLPFLWLMFFWKRDVTTYDHMVFSMYSLSFMSLLFITVVLLGMTDFTSGIVGYLLWLPPVHMFLQLKETYRLTFFSAFWRTIALLMSAGTAFVLFIVMIALISAM